MSRSADQKGSEVRRGRSCLEILNHQFAFANSDLLSLTDDLLLLRQRGIVMAMGLVSDGLGAIRTTAEQFFCKGLAEQEMG